MSRRVSPAIIGIFVLGGIAVLFLGIGLFGSGTLDSRKERFICFFEDSVNGLDIGSPVKLKGVTIGKVQSVLLRADSQAENDSAIPVIIEIDEKLLSARGIGDQIESVTKSESAQKRGLRARLQQQSLITGLLFIEMDFLPNTPHRLHKKNPSEGLCEIPTLPSNLGTLIKSFSQTLEQVGRIPFVEMAEKADRILAQVEAGIGVVDFKGINKEVLDLTASANGLLRDAEVRQLPANLNATLLSVRGLVQKLDGQVNPLASEAQKTAEEIRKTLALLNLAAGNLNQTLHPETGLRGSLDETLRQIADAAQAVRSLANYLERRPNAIIVGKPKAAGRVESDNGQK